MLGGIRMHRNLFLIIAVFISCIIVSCKLFEKEEPKPIEVYGCMDSTATNYNSEATIDDGTCEYDVFGCMDSTATNYNREATIDDGGCDYCEEGSAGILLTTDGGETWDIRCSQEKVGSISDISIVNSNNIWLCTYPSDNVPNAQILHTSNGGRTWEQQYFFDSVPSTNQITFEYIEMFDLHNGIALANDWNNKIPMFLKTTDGGESWIQTTTEAIGISGNIWRRVDFVNVNTGYFYESGVNPQKLLKTIDSGITWDETNFNGYAFVIKFFNENIGVVIDHAGKIHRTFNGGETWEIIETIMETDWSDDLEFHPTDPSKIWLTNKNIYFSSDTGSTWVQCTEFEYFEATAISATLQKVFVLTAELNYFYIADCKQSEMIVLPETINVYNYHFEHNLDCVDDQTIVIPVHIYE